MPRRVAANFSTFRCSIGPWKAPRRGLDVERVTWFRALEADLPTTAGEVTHCGNAGSLFDESLKPIERAVPLLRDLIQAPLCLLQTSWLKLPDTLAPVTSRVPRTTPALARTRKCRVMAWRVTSVPAVSRVMDSGPCSQSRATSPRRVGSPSAPNKGAEAARARIPLLRAMREVLLDELGLMGPSSVVGGEGLDPAGQRDAVEAGLRDGQQRAALDLLQLEDD